MTVKSLISSYNKLKESEKEAFRNATNLCSQDLEDQLSPEWEAEIHRRMKKIQTGEAVFLDANQVEKELVQDYGISV